MLTGFFKKLFNDILRKDELFVFSFSLLFYFSCYFCPNNKVFLLIVLFFLFVFSKKFGFRKAILISYLLCLPFEKGKGFNFVLVPASSLAWGQPYEFWFTITFADSLFLLLVFLLLREKFVKGQRAKKVEFKKGDLFLFLFLIAGFASFFFSDYQVASSLGFLRLARTVAVYFLAQEISFDFLPYILASSLFFEGIWATGQGFLGSLLGKDIEQVGVFYSSFGQTAAEDISFFRSQGTFVHPNTLASFLSMLLVFVFPKIFSSKIFLVSFLAGFLGLLFSASRAAWATSLLILVIFGFFLNSWKKVKIPKGWILAGLLMFFIFFPLLILPRLGHLYQGFQKFSSGYYRLDLIKKAMELSRDYPFGIGLEAFPAAIIYKLGGFFTYPAPVHNLFAQILVETGVLGLMTFLIFLLLTYKKFFFKKKNERINKIEPFFASLCFLGVASFYPLFLVPNIAEYFWLFLGIMVR